MNSVAFQPDRGLRGLSMPFRQGLPLDEIVKRVRPGDRPRPARCLWEVLVQSTAAGTLPLAPEERDSLLRDGPKGDGWNGFPVRGTYAQGVAWVGMILARALHYAHGMQTFHRDVKPGNVLITIHHGPQLLDFNLAESPHSAQHAESAMLGGTLPYMAPEQIEAFLNPDLWGSVGAKADLYSLGLVLRELLTGQAPDLPDDKLPPARSMRELLDRRACLPTDVRRYVPEIPHALDAIVGRCLAFNAKDRYPDGRAPRRGSRAIPQSQAPAPRHQPVSTRACGQLGRSERQITGGGGVHDHAGDGDRIPRLTVDQESSQTSPRVGGSLPAGQTRHRARSI